MVGALLQQANGCCDTVYNSPKGTECDWCGKTEEEFVKTKDLLDIGSTTQTEQNIIDSFNNKGQKGDDDFETWLVNEARL